MAERNILLRFTADTEGLSESSRKLDELKGKEQELLKQIQELQKAQAKDTLNAKNAQEQAAAVQNYGKKIADARKEVAATKKSIEDLAKANKNLTSSIPEKAMEKSFRTLRREVEEQIKTLRNLGQAGSEEYRRLVDEAGRLADIEADVRREVSGFASDTRNFDTVFEGTQLVAGGFSALQGVIALTGTKSEDLQRAMVDLQSGISITTGLTQIQTAIQKESNLMTTIRTLQTKLATKATNLDTAAKSKNIIVSKSATVAQWALNAAAKANPYVLLATAVITVVGALLLFTRDTEKANKAQTKANETTKARMELLDQLHARTKEAAEDEIKRLERQLAVMQKIGASNEDIAKKQGEIINKRFEDAKASVGYYRRQITNLQVNKKKVDELKIAIDQLNKAKRDGDKKTEITIDGQIRKIKVTDEAIENYQSALDVVEHKVNVAVEAKEGFDQAKHERDVYYAEQQKRAKEEAKTEAIATAQIRLLQAKKGSQEELAARIGVLAAERRAYLEDVNLLPSQRLQKELETDQAIRDARRNFRIQELQNEQLYNQARMAMAKEGSDEEFAYQLRIMKNSLDIALEEKDISDEKRYYLEAKYQKDVDDLTKRHNASRNQSQLNAEISRINTQLETVNKGSLEEYNLRIALADKQAELEKQSAELTIKNEEELAAKLDEINAKRLTSHNNALSTMLDFETNINKQVLELQRIEDERILTDINSTYEQRKAARERLARHDFDLIELEKSALEERFSSGLISASEYQVALTDLTIEGEKKRLEIEQEIADRRKQIEENLISSLKDTFSGYLDFIAESRTIAIDKQLEELEKYYTTDKEAAKKNANLKLISEEEYTRRQEELENERKEADKKAKRTQVYANAAEATAAVLMEAAKIRAQAATYAGIPFIGAGLAAAALSMLPLVYAQIPFIAAQSALQIAAINKYWKGRRNGPGEMALVGEQGPELMFIPQGASIVPAGHTRQALNGNTDVLRNWNIPIPKQQSFQMPRIEASYSQHRVNVPEVSREINQVVRIEQAKVNIDYNEIGKAVAKHQKAPVIKQRGDVHVNVDRSGTTVSENGSSTTYKNIHYASKV